MRSFSTFARGALSGTTSVVCTRPPRAAAAKATPSAWLPAEAATIPRACCFASSASRWFVAPRTLNEPVGCQHSSFRNVLGDRIANEARSGVGGR